MGVLNGKIKTVGSLSSGTVDRDSIHPTTAVIEPIVSFQTEAGEIVTEEVKKATTNAFIGKMVDTNTRYKIVQDTRNRFKFSLFSKEIDSNEWKLVDTVEIPKTTVTTGSRNGTISVNGDDVEVKGLKSSAYIESGYFANKYDFDKLKKDVEGMKKSLVWGDIE